ncbi:MAG: hypothetical protein FWH52_07750 [Synergistaceae bacterium]|nr:hypothetical protein [Synergistaceae bacterium]
MILKHIIEIILIISLITNSWYNLPKNTPLSNNNSGDIASTDDLSHNPFIAEISRANVEDEYELRHYNSARGRPLFYGTWKIVDIVPVDILPPSSVSGISEDGTLRGPALSTIVGMEIMFALDYAEYSGEKVEYLCKPRTYTYPLFEDTRLGWSYANTLGINGDYYSEVFFLLPGFGGVGMIDGQEVMRICDITTLYLKDKDTIYAHTYAIDYKLERVSDY